MRTPDDGAADEAAVRRFQSGDEQAFEELVARWDVEILRLAQRLTGDLDAAHDVRQATLLKLYTRLAGFDGRCRLSTWIYRIVLNLCHDDRRRGEARERAHEAAQHAAAQDSPGDSNGAPHAAEPALLSSARAETARRVASAVIGLPAREREVVVLRHYHDLSLASIAAITGSPVTTVQSRLYKGLRLLSTRLEAP
jgi:RNA polymerase sigma-70 factor (ECF subfamily)